MNTRTFTKFAKAAENCRYKNDFQFDLVQCEKAYQMGGEMRIGAVRVLLPFYAHTARLW